MINANIFGDIGGRYDEFRKLLNKCPDSELNILVGDLNDRGPKSRQMIEFTMKMEPTYVTLHSNHGDLFVDFYEGIKRYHPTDFLRNGGLYTLFSYGFPKPDPWAKEAFIDIEDTIKWCQNNIPEFHIKWLKTRPYYYKSDGLFVSHAAWDSRFSLEEVSTNVFTDETGECSLIWNRGEPDKIDGVLQVFGHNARWGVRRFEDDDLWAIGIDDSHNKKLTAYNTKTKLVYQQDFFPEES